MEKLYAKPYTFPIYSVGKAVYLVVYLMFAAHFLSLWASTEFGLP